MKKSRKKPLKRNAEAEKENVSTSSTIENKKAKIDFFPQDKGLTKHELDKAITEFIIARNEPITIVRDDAFRKLVTKLSPDMNVPCYETIRKLIGKEYESMIEKLRSALKSAKYVAVSTDGWTAVNKTYLGYTVTYLDVELKRHTWVLACRRHIGRKNFLKVGKKISSILEEFQISEKTVAVTTDGGSEYAKAFRIYGKNEFCEEEEDEICDENESIDIYECLESEMAEDLELPYKSIHKHTNAWIKGSWTYRKYFIVSRAYSNFLTFFCWFNFKWVYYLQSPPYILAWHVMAIFSICTDN